MARFVSTRDVAAPAADVWDRLTDWPAHGRWIPLTTVRVTSADTRGRGATFTGRSGIGRLGFDDPMEVTSWHPPVDGRLGHCRVVKHGRVVLGWAELDVLPHPEGCTVRWTEEVRVSPVRLTRFLDPVIARAARLGFDRALRLMAREVEGHRTP